MAMDTTGSEEMVKEIGRIQLESRSGEVSEEDRQRHAHLIQEILVSINSKFKAEHPDLG